MAANDRQIGGDHYKTGGEEHWDRMWRLYGRGYFVGCATKYIERYHKKNGVQDLEKAVHFISKLIELETETAARLARDAEWGGADGRYVNQDPALRSDTGELPR